MKEPQDSVRLERIFEPPTDSPPPSCPSQSGWAHKINPHSHCHSRIRAVVGISKVPPFLRLGLVFSREIMARTARAPGATLRGGRMNTSGSLHTSTKKNPAVLESL